tara:strand:+ start:1405 stop:1764 length:360 start_codon:yes stop_codon:yes gene_type:complete
MKVTISYQVDFDDVPESISDLLLLINDNDLSVLSHKIIETSENLVDGLYSQALGKIDDLRHHLAKLDQRLLDYNHILNGYAKADADLKSGMSENDFFNAQQTESEPLSSSTIQKAPSDD